MELYITFTYTVRMTASYEIVLIYETTFTGHRITENNRLTYLGEMPGVGRRFARVGGFLPMHLVYIKKLLWLNNYLYVNENSTQNA